MQLNDIRTSGSDEEARILARTFGVTCVYAVALRRNWIVKNLSDGDLAEIRAAESGSKELAQLRKKFSLTWVATRRLRGESTRKLNDAQIFAIAESIESGKDLSKKYGITPAYVSYIRHGRGGSDFPSNKRWRIENMADRKKRLAALLALGGEMLVAEKLGIELQTARRLINKNLGSQKVKAPIVEDVTTQREPT
jgi:hypothetical protein